jgi:hypothetical protein
LEPQPTAPLRSRLGKTQLTCEFRPVELKYRRNIRTSRPTRLSKICARCGSSPGKTGVPATDWPRTFCAEALGRTAPHKGTVDAKLSKRKDRSGRPYSVPTGGPGFCYLTFQAAETGPAAELPLEA